MKKIEIVFGTYNCLPYGTTDVEFENAYQRSYKPFLTALYKFPAFSATVHYSGILLSWLHERHPEFLMLLNDMVKRSQIELLGGAYYEPILPLIPLTDRSGQIELLTTYLRKRFGKRPRGIWIPELVWEPSLPSNLKNCGMEYTFLPDTGFVSAGIPQTDHFRLYRTEDQGKSMIVFPLLTRLTPARLRSGVELDPGTYLKRLLSSCPKDEEVIVTIIDEGESYGLWNDSYEAFHESGWLESFFDIISERKDEIATTLPKTIANRPRKTPRCYFTCTGADRLFRWWYSLETLEKATRQQLRKKSGRLLPTGNFRQLLKRYAESNLLYSKMLHVNLLVNQIRGDRYRKKAAREELWKGQASHPYWHGKLDGIYRNAIRKAAYSSLIEAEKITREKGIFKPYISKEDFDLDGLDELLFCGNTLNVYVHTIGGTAFEIDYLPASWNYADTMGRYEEPYHDTLIQNSVFDNRPRRSFQDILVAGTLEMESYIKSNGEYDGFTRTGEYRLDEYKRDHLDVALEIEGDVDFGIDDAGEAVEKPVPVSIRKTYSLNDNVLTVCYVLTNQSDENSLFATFGSELNFSFASNHEEFLQIRAYTNNGEKQPMRDVVCVENVEKFEGRDLKNAVTITVRMSEPCELWNIPVESEWYSKNGKQTGYQCSTFVPCRRITLEPGGEWQTRIVVSFDS